MTFKKAKRDSDGAVITAPRNFTTKKPKRGHNDDALFSKPSYISSGDLYQSRSTMNLRAPSKDGWKKAGHDFSFKLPRNFNEKVPKAPYKHMSDRVEFSKKYRDEEGAVITGPPNIVTNPPKKGMAGRGTTLGKFPEFIGDDHVTNAKLMAKKERALHRALEQEKPFSQRAKSVQTFQTIKEQYGEDPVIPPRKAAAPPKPAIVHDVPFKPSRPPRTGHLQTL